VEGEAYRIPVLQARLRKLLRGGKREKGKGMIRGLSLGTEEGGNMRWLAYLLACASSNRERKENI